MPLTLILSFAITAFASEPMKVPDLSTIPKTTEGESVLRGKALLEETAKLLPAYSKAKLNCISCHLNSGLSPNAGPWVGITTRYPQYSARTAKLETLVDRINDCFERSMNGKPLPAKSTQMTDILSYMTWLSKGYSKNEKFAGEGMILMELKRAPDLKKGQTLYMEKCAACHQSQGQGIMGANGEILFPPLWGPQSFNIAAGMARLHTASGFVKMKMPLGQAGSLTDEEAWDVAAYFTRQNRPDFAGKKTDWPKGGKPADARY